MVWGNMALAALGQNIRPEYEASKLAHHIGLDAIMFTLDEPLKFRPFHETFHR